MMPMPNTHHQRKHFAGKPNCISRCNLRWSIFVLLCLSGTAAMADSPAVESSNYELNFHSSDTYESNTRLSYYYAYAGRATFPIGNYLGATLTAEYANNTVLATPSSDVTGTTAWEGCGYHSDNYGVNLFARLPEYGRIGIAYLSNQLKSLCSATFITDGTNKLKTNTYSATAEYYFSRVTLAAEYANTNITNASDITSDTLTASWYPTDLLRLSAAASDLDLKNTYSFEFEYQPPFLDNRFGVKIRFTSQEQAITTQSYLVSISYYFGNDVDLITRDRRYR